jgi:hypothetical protein
MSWQAAQPARARRRARRHALAQRPLQAGVLFLMVLSSQVVVRAQDGPELAGSVAAAQAATPPALDTALQRLAREFPAGSVGDGARAQQALLAADAAAREIAAQAARDQAACEGAFFVNHCVDTARLRRERAEREVWRVRLEAHDQGRADAALAHASARAAGEARRAEQEATRPGHESAAQAQAGPRRPATPAATGNPDRAVHETGMSGGPAAPRRGPALPKRSPGQEQDAQRSFQQKQQAASEYAQRRAAEKAAEEKKRERNKSTP